MWKIQNFSVIQILREINLRGSRSSKNAIFAIFGALNFVNLVNISLKKCKISYKSKVRASQCGQMADFETPDLPTLISRKNWVTEKLCNFHTVHKYIFFSILYFHCLGLRSKISISKGSTCLGLTSRKT